MTTIRSRSGTHSVTETAGEALHRVLYLGLQELRGRPVRRCLRTLREWERLEHDAWTQLRAARLAEALAYARARVPLYASGAWREALAGADPRDLHAWPVLERDLLRTRAEALLAEPRPAGSYFRTTSGSTGIPLRIGFDREAAAWGWALEFHAVSRHGIPLAPKTLALWRHGDGTLLNWLRNQTVLPPTDLSPVRLEQAVRFLLRQRPRLIWGFASAALEVARHARAAHPDAPRALVSHVKVVGETLFPWQREELEELLGARVINVYGCAEIGPLAHECPAGSLHVFAEHVELEIFRDAEPLPAGELGEVVLTSLTNRTMPLVRYRVGDLGRLSPEPCACGRPQPVLAEIKGKSHDVLLAADGTPVHGSALGAGLKKLLGQLPAGAIGRVRFDQLDRRSWTVLVESDAGLHDRAAERLAAMVRELFGAECRITVERVEAIPVEASGKFRYYRAAPAPPPSPLPNAE